MRPRTRSRAALALLLMLMPLAAWAGNADGSALFTLADNDLSKKLIIDGMFGDINGSGGSGLSGAIAVFNSVVTTVAGVLAAYTIVAGTMATAHDGEMLGKKWSSMWLPIRLAFGTALMLPVLNGYSVIQAVILWLAAQGMGAANAVWSAYTQQPVASATFIAPDTTLAAQALAEKMLIANVCVQSYNTAVANATAAAVASHQSTITSDTYGVTPFNVAPTSSSAGVFGYSYGNTSGDNSDSDAGDDADCGEVRLQLSATGNNGVSTQSQMLNDLVNVGTVNSTVQSAQQAGLTAMQASVAPMAQQIAQAAGGNEKPPTPAAVNAALTSAAQAFSSGVNTAVQNAPELMNSSVQANVQQDGWLFAGAWFWKIAKAGQVVSDAVSALPTMSDGTARRADSANALYMDTAEKIARNLIARGVPKNGQNLTGLGAQANADSSVLGKLLSWFTRDKNLDLFSSDANALLNQNPVIGSAELGHKLIVAAWGAFDAGVAAAGGTGFLAGNWVSEKFGAAEAATLVGMLVTPVFFTMFITLMGAGIALALLPMVPYVMWLMGVIGYCILLIEALIGSQIWMCAHIHPDGDGVAGRGGSGYMLILDLTLRPTLMVLGLLCSIALMTPAGYLLTSTFAAVATESGTVSGWAGPTLLIALAVMYGGLMVVIAKKIFSLIHVIPDQILRWIGGGGAPMLAEGMNQAAGHVGGAGKAFVGVMPSMNGQGLQNAGKKLGEENKKNRDERAARTTERSHDLQRDDLNGERDRSNKAGGDALKGSLAKDGNGSDGSGNLAAARNRANADGASALLGALGGGSTGGTAGRGQGSDVGGGAGAKPEASGAAPGEGESGKGNDAASSLRNMLADTEQTGSLKDAKNAGSTGDKEGSGTV
ncbi:conjugal transfer/type IV secretion protein DotA/TraY [Paraburkholderia unamae]|uniref:DotA/TraY family protein n=1 Tax=Paraburkholderia unamae TaxID=219649 RepID=UPI000DC54C3C|nr:DotA/TraY family protein [Paraburkholderia unamae]RAR66859.1 conjugal transfer/type IV secretion protein DotA/TraY [Paraburkholderia unamae]